MVAGTNYHLIFHGESESCGTSLDLDNAKRAADRRARAHPDHPGYYECPDIYRDEEWDHLADRPRKGAFPAAFRAWWNDEWHNCPPRENPPWKRRG